MGRGTTAEALQALCRSVRDLLKAMGVARFYDSLLYRIHLRRIRALKLSIRDLQAERRRLYRLAGSLPAGNDEYAKSLIRIKAIDDHLYYLFYTISTK